MELLTAVKNRNLSKIRQLLENKVDVNTRDEYGHTPLILASEYIRLPNRLETVKEILKYKPDLNIKTDDENGYTALMLAVKGENSEIVKEILKYKPNIDMVDNFGWTALMLASEENDIKIIKLLLDAGANPFIREPNNKDSALELCTSSECKNAISKNIWDRMYQNIKILSRQYSRSGDARFPKDIWELILLRSKQKQLCRDLSNEKNRFILYNFALLLDIPVNKNLNKKTLCKVVSRQLSFGGKYGRESIKYFKTQSFKIKLIKLAQSLGINVNQPIENILDEVTNTVSK